MGRRNFEHGKNGLRKLIEACVELDKGGHQEILLCCACDFTKYGFYSNSLNRTGFVEAGWIPLIKTNANPLNTGNGFWSTSKYSSHKQNDEENIVLFSYVGCPKSVN